ncbi:fungal-specific transcription factor domain-containing protein [Aspergillus pseudoustus]|uniref:Fungal-specific transcription factor domain-containing protein n=1 Tax=Aspergillus pseudoustus TaxID=1810923 RepID=A0ABR4ICS1_9EURO
MESRSNRKAVRQSKHITRACVGCRQRKTKCDGARPQCANCGLHGQECVMPQEVDKRTVPSRERYARLERYIQSLESALVRNGVQLPQQPDPYPTPSSTAMPQNTLDGLSISIEEESYSPVVVQVEGSDQGLDVLSERFGSLQLAEDGQMRFFGATSNLHILHVGLFPLNDSNIRSVYGEERGILRRTGLSEEIPEELENHLLRLYFCWENPNIPVVDEKVFYAERAKYRATGRSTHRYSETLNNAMCAVGAALTRRYPRDLPEPLAEFFSSRAKALLDVEMDAPALCTVQALVILSGVEAFLTRDARGWLYSGMAMRLATDLGLHLKSPLYHKDGLAVDETRLRRVVFWGAYIHDRMWSFYVGRPESLDEKHISVSMLRQSDVAPDDASWQSYIDDDTIINSPEVPALLGDVAEATVMLCRKMSHIRRILYHTPYPEEAEIKSLHASARKLRSDLVSWAQELPASLSLQETQSRVQRPPHLVQLHMLYYAILVAIDRPFTYGRSESLPGLTNADIDESHRACTDAAVAIVELLQTYRQSCGLRQMNIHTVHLIFTAALVHIHNVYFAPADLMRAAARRFLQICCQALSEIGQGYRNALRALEVVTSIKSELERVPDRRSRQGSHVGRSGAASKRVRLSSGSARTPGINTETQLPGAPTLDGLDMLQECLHMSPSSTLMGSNPLFAEPWGWISPSEPYVSR